MTLTSRRNGAIVWFCGLSGAGKSTLARGLEERLANRGYSVVVLDGDALRKGLSADLGFSREDRSEHGRRVAEVARLFADTGVITIVALISPYRQDRERARKIAGRPVRIAFVEVYVSTPLDVCESRDNKSLYARARSGEIPDFTGVSAPFETPLCSDFVIDTSVVPFADAVTRLVDGVLIAVEQIEEALGS